MASRAAGRSREQKLGGTPALLNRARSPLSLTTGLTGVPIAQQLLIRQRKREFNRFSRQMAESQYLKQVEKHDREKLLQELYRLAYFKKTLEQDASTERFDAQLFRKYKHLMTRVHDLLGQSLHSIRMVADTIDLSAKQSPELGRIDLLINGQELRELIIPAAEGLGRAIEWSSKKTEQLAALVNPQMRTDSERKLVKEEILEHTNISLSTNTPKLDHWFIGAAKSHLDKYRTATGERIPRYDKVIEKLFVVGLSGGRTDESIRKVLRRQRNTRS